MPAMVERWATSGLGQWTWYRSRWPVPSRARLPRAAAATRSLVGQVGVTLEASTTESLAPGSARARPSSRSDSPPPYSSAVSIRVMPSERARSTTARASAGPNWEPQPHSGVPNCHAPRPMTDTRRPQAST